jgi:hypothetical protein
MGWNTANVHRLASFEAAKLWHDRTKPIRGNKDNVRPLGSRRHHCMASIEMPDANTVRLKFYDTTLVEWRSDNTYSVFAPKYYSAYTPDNIENYLPLSGQHFQWDRGRLFYCTDSSRKEMYHLPRGSGRLDFQLVDGKSFLLNAPVAYNIRTNRGVVKKLMPQYEAFLSWVQVVLAVAPSFLMTELEPSYEGYATSLGFTSNEEYRAMSSNFASLSPDEREDYWEERYARDAIPFGTGRYNRQIGFHRQACLRMQEMIVGGDPDDWVRVLHVVAYRAGQYHWVSTQNHRKLDAEKAVEYITQLVTYLHRDEAFRLERLPKGVKSTLTNSKFFHDLECVPRKLRQVVDSSI